MAETPFNEGERVRIVEREAKNEDVKSQLYYSHYGGLTGTIQKVYANGEVAVEVEPDSLPEPVRQRHTDVQEQMKSKWLDSLSEDARNRLSDKERDFRLRYTVLVAGADLSRATGAPTARSSTASSTEPPARATSKDLDAAEAAEIARRQRQ